MKRLTRPSCSLLLVLLCMSVAASILLSSIGVTCHDVFVSTLMLVARSNRTIAYIVFNIISIVVFLGFLRSAKPITSGDIDGIFFVPPSPENISHEIILFEDENKQGGYSDDDEDDQYHGYDGYEEDNDDEIEKEEEDEDSEDEEGDSDLEKRSGEFIAKMNGKWREELLHERLFLHGACISPQTGGLVDTVAFTLGI
ncbi:hypothetical protein ACJRO7_020182 [Eucalyptus globulus]|uniref:Transmembrane protein n=1 Tax=Eucalyptus globulus TaxID=34317 RepID=A0ABD3KHG2_EUCGL